MDISQIPSTRIHQDAIKAWKLSGLLWAAIFYIIPGFFWFLYTQTLEMNVNFILVVATSFVVIILHIFIGIILPNIRWKRWRYEVSEKGIDLQRGIIITKRTIIPINRVQHVDTAQGPIYRKYGLSSISLSTAATTHEIPALDDETAIVLRTMISDLVRKVKEDV